MKANKAQDDYPIHFRDKIDEYLFRKHGILAGCCSSIGSLKYDLAREVAEKLTNTLIEKACNSIEKLLSGYIIRNFNFGDSYDIDRLIEDFKDYMKGE